MATSLTEYRVPPPGMFDNHPLDNRHIEVVPLASALGAEIRGVDLKAVSAEAFAEVEAALYRHKVIVFRDQHLGRADQERWTLRFGEFGVDAYTEGTEDHPNVQRVLKEADEHLPMVFGGTWHTDSAFLARPPSISMLHAVEVPPYGGDTWWTNTALAYRFLSDTMQQMLAGLRVHMSAKKVLRAIAPRHAGQAVMSSVAEALTQREMMERGQRHPLVRRHPVTGERSLYVDQTYAVGIDGLTRPESQALIGFLCDHVTQPVFTCRVRWEPNTFVMWDNCTTLHHAFNDYDGYRREMYRTIVEGREPV